ncbi:MAG: SprT family zinc-dependent metalloprotease [Albidovulum sp.]
MTERVLDGDPPVTITLRRTASARRFSLRVSRLDGRVTLSMPAGAREAEALAFAATKAGWLRATLQQTGVREVVSAGAYLPFEGRTLLVTPAQLRATRIQGEALLVPETPAEMIGPRVKAFYKLAARQRLQAACDTYAAQLGRPFTRLTLRDTRSRWGSCTHDGGLMFSWRLIMAPPEVLAYVAAHEVAHLAEMNHSPAFWAVVERLMPDYATHRRWLRGDGTALHRIDFGS